MAGTSWDKLGQMDAAFEVVAPAIRRAAEAERVKLFEFHRDDPLWRLAWARADGGEASVDVEWTEDTPDTYWVIATWFRDDWESTMRRQHVEEIGEFRREEPAERLETMLRDAVKRIDGWGVEDLDEESGPYPEWRQYQTREEFGRTRLPRR